MEVFINQQSYSLPESSTLDAVLHALDIRSVRGLAMAVNERVIPRDGWSGYQLQKEDQVLLIRATQGG